MSLPDFLTTVRSSDHGFIAALRFLDEYAKHVQSRAHPNPTYRHFVPRFNLEQHENTYELYGELAGFRREDITIEAHGDHSIQVSGYLSSLDTQPPPTGDKGETSISAPDQDAADAFMNVEHEDMANAQEQEPQVDTLPTSQERPTGEQKPQENAPAVPDQLAKEEEPQENALPISEEPAEDQDSIMYQPEALEESELDRRLRLEKTITKQERYLNEMYGDVTVANLHRRQSSRVKEAPKVSKSKPRPAVRYLILERHPKSQFHRSFHFPTPIKKDEISATVCDGVLHITAPRAPTLPSRTVPIRNDSIGNSDFALYGPSYPVVGT